MCCPVAAALGAAGSDFLVPLEKCTRGPRYNQRSSSAKFSQIYELPDTASYYAHYLGPCNSYIKI